MRGCLFVLLAGAAMLLGAAWFAGPPLAGSVVAAGLALTGFSGEDTRVEVTADPPIAILGGRADTVRVTSSDVRLDGWTAGGVDLTFVDVGLVDRSADRVRGSIRDLVIGVPGPGELAVASVVVDGPLGRADATVRFVGSSVEDVLAARIEAATGIVPDGVRLRARDVVAFDLGGRVVEGRLVVEASGDVALRLPVAGTPSVHLATADRLEPLRVASVAVDGGDLVVRGTLDVGDLIR